MINLLKTAVSCWNIELSPSAEENFAKYCEMLIKRNKVMNLTAVTEPDAVYLRHFADSLAIASVENLSKKSVIDIGSGAGFPGLPLKIADNSIDLTCLDATKKRVDFIAEVAENCGLSVTAIQARAEEAAAGAHREKYDVAVSRAVASMPVLAELCLGFVKPGGVFIAQKTAKAADEIACSASAIEKMGGKLEKLVPYHIEGNEGEYLLALVRKIGETPKGFPRKFAKIEKQPL